MKPLVMIYIAALSSLGVGAFALSYSGATLPGPDEAANISLRNVESRRSHFVRHYAFGK